MTAGPSTSFEPVLIEGSKGRLFAIHHRPARAAPASRAVLYVPPFAEEMNRARRMAALQARAFAAAGLDVLILDLHGTGDSAGEFRDARWEDWLAGVVAGADWLDARGRGAVVLWGLRLGGLIAASVAASQPRRFSRLLLWQPVTEGRQMLTQFLRVRVAASLGENGLKETTEGLRTELSDGRTLEVAGYEVAPELASAIDGARLDGLALSAVTRIDWLEVSAAADARLPPARQRIVDTWRQMGMTVSAAVVAGEAFWTTQEISLAPALIEATERLLQS